MSVLREAVNRVRSFFHKPERDAEMEAELRSHLELAIAENMQQGMSAEEARRRALVRFGGVEQAKELHREKRGLPWLDVLMQDLKFTFRTLRRDRGFAAIAILILGLGIGANVAVFSVVNTVLLRPLPFKEPQQLVRILSKKSEGGESSKTYSTDATKEFQERTRTLQAVSGYFAFSSSDNVKLIGEGQPLPLTGLLVMGNFFQTLGVEPALGRLFTPAESQKNAGQVTLLSNAFWKRRFHGDRSIVGRAINFDGMPYTVVGVLPETFDFGSVFSPGAKVDAYMPAVMENMEEWGNTLALIGRLRPGVTRVQAQTEADLIFPQLPSDLKHPQWKADYTAQVIGLKDYVSGKLRRSLIVLWCAVGMILLIVCVNLSNLLLARAATRNKEFALRSALGAGRMRLVRQLLTESLVLSAAGAVLGLGTAFAVTGWLAHQGSIALPLLSSVRVDATALAWTVAIALVTAVLFGLTPGLKIAHWELVEALKDSGHGASEGRGHERMRSVLVISEVALACVLVVGAGLLLRSFLRVLDVDLGFQPSRSAAIQVDYNDKGDNALRTAIWRNVIERVQAIPGVEAAGISDNLPMSRNRSWVVWAKGRTYSKGQLQDTFVYIVSPGYLRAMGMRLVEGRDIAWEDGPKSQKVVLINETVARRLWPGEDPVGKTANASGTEALVIGVVADVRETNAEEGAGWQMYLPASQFGPDGAELVVRTKLPPEELASSVMTTLRQINPGQPAVEFRTIQQLVDHATSPRKFFVVLVSIFAGLGLLLAALGIYGVISYSVTQKTQEIGIRMALGATQGRVQRDVLAKTLRMAVVGTTVGIVASVGVSRLIATLLFGTQPTDVVTFAAMVVALGAVAFVAGYVPARRASRIEPSIALRSS